MSLNKLEDIQDRDNHAFDSSRYFFTLMDDLTPDVISGERQMYLEFGDTLDAVQQDTRRDPGTSSWKSKDISEDAVGWE
jgi:hypothetical protein